MAKRFTDTEKWNRPWFRKLPARLKCFWDYIVDHCDQIGVWYVDFELASIFIGEEINREEATLLFEKQIRVLDQSRWFIKDFVPFQYGELKDTNNFHVSLRLKLQNSGVSQGLNSPRSGDKVKVKDKESLSLEVPFEDFYLSYPKKQDRKKAEEVWKGLALSKEQWGQMVKPQLELFKKSEDWLKEGGKYIPLPSTWLRRRRWEDQIEVKNVQNRNRTGLDRLLDRELQKDDGKREMGGVPGMFRGVDET